MKREANKKRANRMFSLLLTLTLCAAPVSGGTAVYAAVDGSENISGATAPETAVGTGAEGEKTQEAAGQEPAGELPEEALAAGDSTAEAAGESIAAPAENPAEEPIAVPVEEPAAVPTEELTEAASMEADLLAADTTDWIDYADSTWTVDQPIMDAADLAQMAVLGQSQNFSGKTITLGADIDLSGHLWTPIGNDTYKFSGIFDGGNHQITGLDTGNRLASAGLFGTMVGSATVRNLRVTVERVHASGSVTRTGVGGLVGRIYNGSGGTIYNCQITLNGTIYASANDGKATNGAWSGGGAMVGVDESSILIDNCFVHVKPGAVIECRSTGTANVHIGGFVGIAVSTDIIRNSKCIMEGTIHGSGESVNTGSAGGGFIGWADHSQILNCYGITTSTSKFVLTNTNPTARPSTAAPFLGLTNGPAKISDSYAIDLGATYELEPNPNQGAILGYANQTTTSISDCYYYTESGAPSHNANPTTSNVNAVSTLEEMKKESTYPTFDFVNTWTIVPELNDGYPVLQMELTDQQKMDIVTALVAAEKTFIVASDTDETVKLQAVQSYVDGLVSGSLFTKAGGTATAVKSGSAYQITFQLGNITVQKTVTAQFVKSSQTKAQMMAEAVSAIPQTAEIVVAENATQLQKKTAVESYVRGLLDPLDFTKANGTFAVALTSGTTYSVALTLAEVEGKTVSVTVTFVNGVLESDVTLVTEGGLLTLFNGTAGYGQNNVLFEVKANLESGKKLVYQENGTERPIYWSPILQSYVGFTTQGELSKAELAGNIQSVAGTAETIRYGIIGTGRDNRVKIGFTDLYYFDKTVLIDDAIPEGDAERALAMDVNGDFNLSVSDLMSIIQNYVFGTEFSKATK